MNDQNPTNFLNKMNTLLIIGNGFDLHCGLKSSFKNYFESELLDSNRKPIVHKVLSNMWNLIFYYAYFENSYDGGETIERVDIDDPLWTNVEDYIKRVLSFKNKMPSRIVNIIQNAVDDGLTIPDMPVHSGFQRQVHIDSSDKAQVFNIRHLTFDLIDEFGYDSAISLLRGELGRFESDFNKYLDKEVKQKENEYSQNVNKFILEDLGNYSTRELYVLSFNYTKPFSNCLDSNNLVSIHGTLEDKNIIIGIGVDPNVPNSAVEFRKTNRRIRLNLQKFLPPDVFSVDEILCYGCSLGKPDYPYFFSLLNNYRIGISNTKIVFLYSDFGKNQKENDDNKQKLINNIRDLVNEYSNKYKISDTFEELNISGIVSIREFEEYVSETKNTNFRLSK